MHFDLESSTIVSNEGNLLFINTLWGFVDETFNYVLLILHYSLWMIRKLERPLCLCQFKLVWLLLGLPRLIHMIASSHVCGRFLCYRGPHTAQPRMDNLGWRVVADIMDRQGHIKHLHINISQVNPKGAEQCNDSLKSRSVIWQSTMYHFARFSCRSEDLLEPIYLQPSLRCQLFGSTS